MMTTTAVAGAPPRKAWYRQLWTQVLIAMGVAKWENALDEPRLRAVLDGTA